MVSSDIGRVLSVDQLEHCIVCKYGDTQIDVERASGLKDRRPLYYASLDW